MICPKCNGSLQPFGTSEGVELDFCGGCSGILFDQGELADYFELTRDIPGLEADLAKARPTSRRCPKCNGPWVEIPYAGQEGLLIDLCTGCGAIWLDKGEFPKLERLAATLESPQSKLARAAQMVECEGYRVVGWRRAGSGMVDG